MGQVSQEENQFPAPLKSRHTALPLWVETDPVLEPSGSDPITVRVCARANTASWAAGWKKDLKLVSQRVTFICKVSTQTGKE